MNETVRVACSQAEPVVLSRDATIDKLETPAAEAAGSGAEGILYADLDPARLWEERQRFDPAGHYHRPGVLSLTVTPRK